MAEMAIAAAVIGSATSAAGQIMSGRETARAAQFEAAQYEAQQRQLKAQEQATKTAAMQAETRRRDELTSSMETIQALRGGRGVGLDSPTGMAILDSIREDGQADITSERLNYLSKADSLRQNAELSGTAASISRKRAKTSLLTGYLGAASTVANTAFKYGSMK